MDSSTLVEQVNTMMRFAADRGLAMPDEVKEYASAWIDAGGDPDRFHASLAARPPATGAADTGSPRWPTPTHALLDLHDRLLRFIAPVTPRTIASSEHHSRFGVYVANRTTVWLMVLTGVSFLTLIISGSICGWEADADHRNRLAFILLLIGAAGTGAGYRESRLAHSFIDSYTFDPRYFWRYVSRFMLGAVAGVFLAIYGRGLIEYVQGDGASHYGPPAGDEGFLRTTRASSIAPPLLAFLGGFGSEVVEAVLQRASETLRTLITGPVVKPTDTTTNIATGAAPTVEKPMP